MTDTIEVKMGLFVVKNVVSKSNSTENYYAIITVLLSKRLQYTASISLPLPNR